LARRTFAKTRKDRPMDFQEELFQIKHRRRTGAERQNALFDRAQGQLAFAKRLLEAHPAKAKKHGASWGKAARVIAEAAAKGAPLKKAVADMEKILSPLSRAAKEYALHLVGHAHIDMNWMWPWQETVAVTQDTFTTVLRLMREFPQFTFSQSQASVYRIVEEYCPELFEEIKERVREGRWEVTASMWVEGDKNLPSGESLARHLLLTRRYFKEKFDLAYDAVQLDFEPDTFGHANTIPSLLARGGVRWYYHCRTGEGQKRPPLFWWEAPDGSRVLCHKCLTWYNAEINLDSPNSIFSFEKNTGLKDCLFVYGVGDHGGGPTRRDLLRAAEMSDWPIFPTLRFSTLAAWFKLAEAKAKNLPVHKGEMNFEFAGCYTSQSSVKRGVRLCENALGEAETAALVGGIPYPQNDLNAAWRDTLFCHFHDILPGSGVHATYEYSNALFQGVLAKTGAIRARALRNLAALANTAAVAAKVLPPSKDTGKIIGGGVGNNVEAGRASTFCGGGGSERVFMIFNSCAFPRSEVVHLRLWDTGWPQGDITVLTPSGKRFKTQESGQGEYWGHQFKNVIVPVALPACGYVCLRVVPGLTAPPPNEKVIVSDDGVLENDFVRVKLDFARGGIVELTDKRTGKNLVAPGGLLGGPEFLLEEPHGMTSWVIGRALQSQAAKAEIVGSAVTRRGPHKATIKISLRLGATTLDMETTLTACSPLVNVVYGVNWLERGAKDIGVPCLRARFDLNIPQPKAVFETPCGTVERAPTGEETPSQKFVNVSGEGVGATLLNDSKFGHRVYPDGTLTLNLLRSSYDPDPLPELGRHEIRFALMPHDGTLSTAAAVRLGQAYNQPPNVIGTDLHEGQLPAQDSFCEVLNDNVILSGLKKAEDSEALIVRLYEVAGKDTVARVRLGRRLAEASGAAAEIDFMEQPTPKNGAEMLGGEVRLKLPANGIGSASVKRAASNL
jgi:alpha-mannosidase